MAIFPVLLRPELDDPVGLMEPGVVLDEFGRVTPGGGGATPGCVTVWTVVMV